MKIAFGLLFLICLPSPCCLHAENGAGEAQGRTGVDEGLRQAIERTTYRLDASGPGSYAGANPAQRLDLDFNAGGAWLRAGDPAADAGLRLTGYGYGTRLRTPGPATLTAAGTRAEYQRDGICEWYRNTSRGLEQGFTLTRRPGAGQQAGPLVIAVEVRGGLRPVLSAAGDAVLLRSGQRTLLRYAGLEVRDARGRIVPSHLDVRGRAIRLVVQDSNAEYPLVVDPLVSWYQEAELSPSDAASSRYGSSRFGNSVSVSGNMAVVGAEMATVNSNPSQGAVYVFVKSGGVWTQQAELTAADGAESDHDGGFGRSVSLSGNTILVGDTGAGRLRGAAYVFVESGGVWTQQAKLTDADNDAYYGFGGSVSVSGNTAVVGVSYPSYGVLSAAFVFVESGGVWTRRAKLTPADYSTPNDTEGFGWVVSVNGSKILIGAPGKTVNLNSQQGAAYVFVESGGVWTQQAKLIAADGAPGDYFGESVSLSGNTILVGAPHSNNQRGAAYVFVESDGVWTQQAKLTVADSAAWEFGGYGGTVSLSGNMAVVGAPNTAGHSGGVGGAYVFVESGGVWTLQTKLTGDGTPGGQFGSAVSLDGPTALVGAPNPWGVSKAYVFLPSPPLVNASFEQGSSSPVSFTGRLGGGASAATGWYIWNNYSGTTMTELCTAVSCPSGSVPPAPFDGANTLHVTTTSAASGVYQFFPRTNITGASLWLKVVSGTVLVELLGPGNRMVMTTAGTGVLWLPAKGVYNEIAIYSLASGNTEFYADDLLLTNAYPVVVNPSFEQGSSSPVSFTGRLGGGASAATGWYIWNNYSGTTMTELCTAVSCPSGSVPPAPFDGANTLHVTTTSAASGVYQFFPATNIAGAFLWLKVVRGTVLVELLGPGNRVVKTTASTGVLWLPVKGVYNEIVIYSLTSGNTEFYADDVIPE